MSAGKGEKTETQHVPSPTCSRRTTTIPGCEDIQEPDSMPFVQKQKNGFIESTDNSDGILPQSQIYVCHDNESNIMQSSDGHISIVINIEKESQNASSLELFDDKDIQKSNALLCIQQKDGEKNAAIETRQPKSPDFPVRRKSLAKIQNDQHVLIVKSSRRYSMVENIAKAELTEENLSNDFGQGLSFKIEEITNQSCKNEEDKNQYLSSPKSFRKRKSLVKTRDGQTLGQCLLLLQQQNSIGKTDINGTKMSQSTKNSDSKKSMKRKCDEKHSHLHRQRIESNVTSEECKIQNETSHIQFQIDDTCDNAETRNSSLRDEVFLTTSAPTNVHQRRKSFSKIEEIESRMCSLHRGNCNLDCEEPSHVTNVTHRDDRRKSMNYEHYRTQSKASSKALYRRHEDIGTPSVSITELVSSHSVRRASVGSCKDIDDRTCKSQKANRKKKKAKNVSRSVGRSTQKSPSYNANNSMEHHEDVYGKSVVFQAEKATQESIEPLNLIQELENMNISSTCSRPMKTSIQYNDNIEIQRQIGDSNDGKLVTYLYENDKIDSQAAMSTHTTEIKEPIEDVMTSHVHKKEKSFQDAERIRGHTSCSPLVRKRTKYVQEDDTKRMASMSPIVRQRRRSIQGADDIKRQTSKSPGVRHRKIVHADDINNMGSMSPQASQSRKSIKDADDIKGPASRSPMVRQRRKSIQIDDGIKKITTMSPLAHQRRKSLQGADDTQSPIPPVLNEMRMSIQDTSHIDSQAPASPLVQERNSAQDADFKNEISQLIPLEDGSSETSSSLRRMSFQNSDINNQLPITACVLQRRKSIQDTDLKTHTSMSSYVQRMTLSFQDDDVNSQASMSQRVRQRRKSIQDADMNSQLPMSPRVRQRRKSIQDADVNSQLPMSPRVRQRRNSIQDADVNSQLPMSPCVRQRRKSIQDADVNSQLHMSPRVRQRRKSIQDADVNSQLPMSPRVRQRRKSIQDADVNSQLHMSPRVRQRRKSIQDADMNNQLSMSPSLGRRIPSFQDADENSPAPLPPLLRHRRKSFQDADLKTQTTLSLLVRPKTMSIEDYNDTKAYTHGYPCLQHKRKSIQDHDGNIRQGLRRKSIQDSDDIMMHIPVSPRLQQRRISIQAKDDNTTLRPWKQMHERTNQDVPVNKDGQKIYRPPFAYGNLGSPASETVTVQITGPETSDADLVKPQRKRSLSLSDIHSNEISEQSRRDENSSSVHSFNLSVQQQIDRQMSPSYGREMKPTLIQKEIRGKLAKSARRSSFSAVSATLGPFSVDPFSVLKGRNLEVKPVEQVENFGPFSRRARKASLIASQTQSQNCSDKEIERPKLRRKMSLPVNMLTHSMSQDNEGVTHDVSVIQQAANFETFQHKTRKMSQVSEAMAPEVACSQPTNSFDGVRRKTRRMSLPDTNMFSNLTGFSEQSFCHQIPGNIRRIAAARPIKNPFEHQSNLCLQRPSNPYGDDKNFPTEIFDRTNTYQSKSSEDRMLHGEVSMGKGNDRVDFEELPQCQTPEVSPVVSEIYEEEMEKEGNNMPRLNRQDSVTSEITLPPRTPEPEVMAEFSDGKAEGSQTDEQSYKPRYCWCTRCKLMYRMYKDDDSGLVSWGNYPCFKF